jgi:hypothetical protein
MVHGSGSCSGMNQDNIVHCGIAVPVEQDQLQWLSPEVTVKLCKIAEYLMLWMGWKVGNVGSKPESESNEYETR